MYRHAGSHALLHGFNAHHRSSGPLSKSPCCHAEKHRSGIIHSERERGTDVHGSIVHFFQGSFVFEYRLSVFCFVFGFVLFCFFYLFCFLRQGFSTLSWLSRNSLCIDQASLELRDLSASASQVLGLKGLHHHTGL